MGPTKSNWLNIMGIHTGVKNLMMKITEKINQNRNVNNTNMNNQQLSIGNADVLYTAVRKILVLQILLPLQYNM